VNNCIQCVLSKNLTHNTITKMNYKLVVINLINFSELSARYSKSILHLFLFRVNVAVNTGHQNMSPVTSSVHSAFVAVDYLCSSDGAPSTGKVMRLAQNGVIRTVVVPSKSAKCYRQRARMRVFHSTPTLQTGHTVVTSSRTTISQSPNVLSTLNRFVSHIDGTVQCGVSQVRTVIPIMPKPVASSSAPLSSTQSTKLKAVDSQIRVNSNHNSYEPTVACYADLGERSRQNLSKRSVAIGASKRRAAVVPSRNQVLTVPSSSSLSFVPAEYSSNSVRVGPVCRPNWSQNHDTTKTSTESLSRNTHDSNACLRPAERPESTCGVKNLQAAVVYSTSQKNVSALVSPRACRSVNTPSSLKKLRPIAAVGSVNVSQPMTISNASSKEAPHMAQLNSTLVMPVFTQSSSTASNNVMDMASACINAVVATSPVIHLQNTGTVLAPATNVSPSQHGFTNIYMQQPQQYYPNTGISGFYTQPTYNTSPLQLSNHNSYGPMFVELSAGGVVRNHNTASNQPTNVIVIQNSNVFLCSPPQQSNITGPVFNGSVNNMLTVPPTGVLPFQSNMSTLVFPDQYRNLHENVSNQPCFGAVSFSQQPYNVGLQNCSLQQLAMRPPSTLQIPSAINVQPSMTCAEVQSIGHRQLVVCKADQSRKKPLVKLHTPYRKKLLNKGLKTLKRVKPSIMSPSVVKKADALVQNGAVAVRNQEQTAKPSVLNRRSQIRSLNRHLKRKHLLSQTPRAILPRPSQLELPICNVAIGDALPSIESGKQLINFSKQLLLKRSDCAELVTSMIRSRIKKNRKPKELTSSDAGKFRLWNVGVRKKCSSKVISDVETSATTNELRKVCQGQNVMITTSKGTDETASNVNSLENSDSESKVILNTSNSPSPVSNMISLPRIVPDRTKDDDERMVVKSIPKSSVASSTVISKSSTANNNMFDVRVRLVRIDDIATGISCSARPSSTMLVRRNIRDLVTNSRDGDSCLRSVVETVHSQQTSRPTNDCINFSPIGSSDSLANDVYAAFVYCTASNRSKRLNNFQSSRTRRLMFEHAQRDKL